MRVAIASAAVLLVLSPRHVEGQIIRVAGSVKDAGGQPVRAAIVTAINPDQAPPRIEATSNDKGQFAFMGIRRGLWTITVEAPGFEPVRFERAVSPGPRQEPIDVRLTRTSAPVALPMDTVRGADIQQRMDRAEALAASGDIDTSIAAWREILARVPSLTTVYLRIGALYERKPDRERALEAYRQLLKLEPANNAARAAVERLNAKS